MTWAISRKPLRPGALVTAGDVCHLHPDRAAAERCGALMGGDPDLVRLEALGAAMTTEQILNAQEAARAAFATQ